MRLATRDIEHETTARLRQWAAMNSREFDGLDPAETVVVLSCSPLEVHGPHLPMMTDYLEAQGLMVRALELMQDRFPQRQFLELPPLYVATDVLSHRGSVHFRPATLRRVLEDLGRSLTAQGFRDIWVSSFHGGPRHFLSIEMAAEKINRRHGGRMISLFSMLVGETGEHGDLREPLGHILGDRSDLLAGDMHGGLLETSMVLALLGGKGVGSIEGLPRRTVELWLEEKGVDVDRLKSSFAGGLATVLEGFEHRARFYWEERYAGAPGEASEELGEAFLEELAQLGAQALTEVLEGQRALEDCHSPIWPLRHLLCNPLVGWLFERRVGLESRVF